MSDTPLAGGGGCCLSAPGKGRSPGSSLCLGDTPGGAPCDCWMGSEFWLPLVLPDWGESLLLAGRKVSAPYFISCDTTWVRVSRDVWAPHPTSAGAGEQRWLWCLPKVEHLLSRSFLSRQAIPSLALWLEKQAFTGTFFVCIFGHFQVACFSFAVWDKVTKGNPGQVPPCQCTKVPSPSAFFSLPFSLLLFYI